MSASQAAAWPPAQSAANQCAANKTSMLGPRRPSDLRRIKLFQGLSDEELARVAPLLSCKKALAKDFCSAEDIGEPGISFIWRGQCRVLVLSPGGQHATIRLVRSGEHFGEINILAEAAQVYCHLAFDQDSVLLRLSAGDFHTLMRSTPAFTHNVLRHLAETAMARAERIYEFSILDSRLRLQAALLRLSQQGLRHGNIVTIIQAPTHEELAAQIGMTREGVTRHMRSMAQQGLVASKRSMITILDVARLTANVEKAAGHFLSYSIPNNACA